MSLRVWLPLNGNLNNQGASGCNPVQTTAPTYVNGKIGKAMSTGAFYLPAVEVAKFYNNNAMSWCFWIYPTGSGGNAILGQQSMTAGNNRMFTIFQYPNPVDLHLSWQGEAQNNATFLSTIVTGAFTLNMWVKPKSMSNQHFLFGTFDNWTGNGIGIWRDTGTPAKYNCLIKSASESGYSNLAITTTLNNWNMITLVYTGTTYIRYLNGVEQGRVTYGSNGVITNPNFMVGNSKYNSTPASENEEAFISDVRFYATALSADDIKELYQTSASITNNGTVMCLDFQEN